MSSVARTAELVAAAWGPVTAGAPLVAWGLLACGIPVLVHLVLRQRPRRQVLPTMRLLVQSHRASTRAHRLKHLLLLLCRVTLIALLVGMLMKLGCASGGEGAAGAWLGATGEPASAVICLDDSASMGYRFQGRSRLRRATDWANNLVEDPARFPAGSQVAVVTGSTNPAAAAWTQDLAQAHKRIDAVHVADHDRSVVGLLRQAYPLLSTGRHTRREIYLLTDLTRHSWRDSPPPAPKDLTALYVLNVGQAENRNVALGWPQVPDHILPTGAGATITVRVRSGDQPADPVVEVAVDGQTRCRQAVGHLAGNHELALPLTLPPMTKGIHAVTVYLEPADALACDNERFASVSVGALPRILVARGKGNREVAALVTAMIAPSAQPADRHRFALEQVDAGGLARVENLDQLLAVILADVDALAADGWHLLSRYVEAGGVLFVVPGPNATLPTYRGADALLPAPIESIEECPEPITLAATDLTHPFLRPFADATVDSINDRRVFKRLILGQPTPDAGMIAPFSDHRPALVSRRAGKGRVILLAFSPARDWGQFGTQAAPMIVLMHTMLTAIAPPVRHTESFTVGQVALRHVPDPRSPVVAVHHAADSSPPPLPIEDNRVRLPTDRAGYYQVLTGDGQPLTGTRQPPTGTRPLSTGEPGKPPPLHYTVNVAEAESDGRRITPTAIEALFPPGLVVVADDAQALARRQAGSRERVSLAVPVGLALLGLVLIETLFANRFYGFPSRSSAHT